MFCTGAGGSADSGDPDDSEEVGPDRAADCARDRALRINVNASHNTYKLPAALSTRTKAECISTVAPSTKPIAAVTTNVAP
jgi:hypothetical protein